MEKNEYTLTRLELGSVGINTGMYYATDSYIKVSPSFEKNLSEDIRDSLLEVARHLNFEDSLIVKLNSQQTEKV